MSENEEPKIAPTIFVCGQLFFNSKMDLMFMHFQIGVVILLKDPIAAFFYLIKSF